MRTIPEILNFPNGTPIDAVQGRLKVFERRAVSTKFGPTTAQKASMEDIGGNRIRLDVWGHPDLMPMDGVDIVLFSAGKGGKGVRMKHGSYKKKDTGEVVNTVELDVNKYGQFQTVEIYKSTVAPSSPAPSGGATATITANYSLDAAPAGSGQPPAPQNPVKGQETALPGKVAIRGDKVGMSINNAVHIIVALTEQGIVPKDMMHEIGQKASDIIRLSNWLEQGNLYPEVKVEAPKAPERAISHPPMDEPDRPF